MQVVHVNTTDIHGGAARAAFRLNEALNQNGVDSKMLVLNKISDQKFVYQYSDGILNKYFLNNARTFFEHKEIKRSTQRKNISFSTGKYGYNPIAHPLFKDADIINLHWTNKSYISLNGIKSLINSNKKIVWTLHDMWSFTGGCHYSNSCEKYLDMCGACPILKSSNTEDLSTKVFKYKSKIFNNKDLSIVTCSNWLKKCAANSKLFRDKNISVIPNTLNINLYKPINKNICKSFLGIDKNKFVILFGAMDALSDKRKGYNYLKKMFKILNNIKPNWKDKIQIVVFGASDSNDIRKIPYDIKFVGKLSDDYALAALYNAANVLIVPSLQDNLPNTIMESLSCGTPVISFNVGGIPDMIDHKKNGYLAKYKSAKDLANGLQWIISKNNLEYENICKDCRNKVIKNYNNKLISNKYIKIYESKGL